jgi:hypothetical protein
VGPNEMVERAEIFRVDTSINTLSIIKFSNLYLAATKSYESTKLSKMLIFAYSSSKERMRENRRKENGWLNSC